MTFTVHHWPLVEYWNRPLYLGHTVAGGRTGVATCPRCNRLVIRGCGRWWER